MRESENAKFFCCRKDDLQLHLFVFLIIFILGFFLSCKVCILCILISLCIEFSEFMFMSFHFGMLNVDLCCLRELKKQIRFS